MKIIILAFPIFFGLLLSGHLWAAIVAPAATMKTQYLILGEQTKLPLKSNRIWIENSKIVKGETTGNQLKISGVSEGSSLLRIGDQQYQIYVLHPKKQEALFRLQEALKKIIGLQVQYAQGETQIQGQLFRLNDWKTLAEQLKNSEINYRMAVQFSESLKLDAQKYFDDVLRQNSLPTQKINFADGVTVRLPLKNFYTAQYKKILNPYGVDVVEDAGSLSLEPTVRIQITLAEVHRDWIQKIGLRWPSSYQAQILPETLLNFSSINAVADFVEQNGKGKILASPNLICRSGKEADFVAGGEFPIKIMNFATHDVVWKKYGIVLKVKPLADALGQMSLQIDTEVSSLDPAKAVEGIPAIITHHVSSYFDLRKPQTIALSGLIKNEEGQNSEGLPWLSRLPVLGPLFASKEFRENRSELIILVRPEIVDLQNPDLETKPQHLLSYDSYGN